MSSIRRFLVVVLLATTAIVALVAIWYGYRNSMAEAEQLFDKRLSDVANVLAETPAGYYRTATGDSAIAFQVWEAGTLQASSANAPTEPIASFETGFSNISFGGFNWRAYAKKPDESDRWVMVAESTDIRFMLADRIILDSVLPIILSLPVFGLLIWLIVGRGLSPLNQLARQMNEKRSDDLSPIADLDPPQELSALVDSINALLKRLDNSFERERRLAADAAHELRTPISVLKIQLHNLLRESSAQNPQLKSLEETVERISYSTEQVLMLYRTAPDQFVADFKNLDLASLARETIAELYAQIEIRQQDIELIGSDTPITGDAFALKTLLSNLISNASRYSGEGGKIRVTVAGRESGPELTVEDSGPGIPNDQRERVFERFYRGDNARTDTATGGSGIGLSIVRQIADIHGARISLSDSGFQTGLAVSIRFPARPESHP